MNYDCGDTSVELTYLLRVTDYKSTGRTLHSILEGEQHFGTPNGAGGGGHRVGVSGDIVTLNARVPLGLTDGHSDLIG